MNARIIRGPAECSTNLKAFQSTIEQKYGVQFETYWDFHRWSIENSVQLWSEIWNFLCVVHSVPFSQVIEENKRFEEIPKWFLGSRLNYAENILKNPDEDVALILTGETRTTVETVTFGQLKDEVSQLSCALRNAGLRKGDVMACFISNRKEAITAILAAASVGALFTAVAPLMGAKAVVSRFRQLSPKVLLAVDRFVHMGKVRNVLKCLPDVVKGIPSLEHVIVVRSEESSDISTVPKSIFYHDFLKTGFQQDGKIPSPHYEQLCFNDPFLINYTSGTTGPPKGIVHSVGSTLIGSLSGMCFSLNIKRNDVMLALQMPGWAVWNCFLAASALGAAQVVFEGFAFRNNNNGLMSYWDILDRCQVSCVFIHPYILEDMEKTGNIPGPRNHLRHLRTIASGSAHVKHRTYDFVYYCIKSDVFFSMIYGATEFLAFVGGMNHDMPVYSAEIQVPLLGIDLRCFNEEGKPILDEKGELVICNPSPFMPLYYWKDEKQQVFSNHFHGKFPGVWCQQDYCAINSQTGGITVYGRSDETVKQRGIRFGPSEMYCIVNRMAEVTNSLCVSRINKDGDEVAVLFVKTKPPNSLTPELSSKMKQLIENELSFRHVPELIYEVKDIPYNINGKRMELLVKKILSQANGNISSDTITNSECLQEYIEIANHLTS